LFAYADSHRPIAPFKPLIAASWLRPSSHFMLDPAQSLDLDPNGVAGGQKAWRVHRKADPGRCTGQDQVARLKPAGLGQKLDYTLRREDHLGGRAVLAQLAVDPGLYRQPARVGNLIRGGDPGPPGAERVGPFGAGPVPLPFLQI